MATPQIFPVIHYLNYQQMLNQADLAFAAGADGVFLISHQRDDLDLLTPLLKIKTKYPNKFVGINFLNARQPYKIYQLAQALGADGLWCDDVGISSSHSGENAIQLHKVYTEEYTTCKIFGSCAFKYKQHDRNPELAAKKIRDFIADNGKLPKWIPTTSGSATGIAPDIEKIRGMSAAVGGNLAIASGMTPENVANFAPYLSHILVASGVSLDFHHLDIDKLDKFVNVVKDI